MDEYVAKRLEDMGQIKEISVKCFVDYIPSNYQEYTVEILQRWCQGDTESLKERINSMQNAIIDIMKICKGETDKD